MKTSPLYLTDPYLKSSSGTIIEVIHEDEKTYRIILDQTIFYPMGGGQPTDQGLFIYQDGRQLQIYQVLLKDGEINHYLKSDDAPILGESLNLSIDWDRRYKNMKVHSAGHIVDFALYQLGYSPSPLNPIKGDHGKKPFITYSGELDKDILPELQNQVNQLLSKNLNFSWSFELLEDLEKEALYLQPGLPKNKPLRALRLESVGTVADGGTMVANTREIGPITVLSVKSSGNETTIAYKL